MQNFRSLLSLFVCTILFSYSSLSQVPDSALVNVKENYEPEKIFIHFDKLNYVAGETIWFKTYVFAGLYLSNYSSIISVELLNDSGKIISRKILPLIRSTAAGEFDIPKESPQIIYTVRAYTRRMQNFGSSFFFEQPVMVYNPSKMAAAAPAVQDERMFFLPEGGNMIAGNPSVIAFKCMDAYGYPVDADGDIVNSKGEVVTTFKSVHDGMGKFYLLPAADETYTAVYKVGARVTKVVLPAPKVSGVVVQVQSVGAKKYFMINKDQVINEAMMPAYLLGTMDNQVAFKIQIPKELKSVRGAIPLEQLPSGILQLTLFNADNQPLSERMLFINNGEFLSKGTFKTDSLSFHLRAKNVFSYEADLPQMGTYSVSVTDYNKEISGNQNENIISRTFLSNEIKGYLHNPLYYFSGNSEEIKANLDLVMLTNGWRRFNWEQMLSKRLPAMSYKDPNYISIKGTAYTSGNNKLIPFGTITAFVTTKDSSREFLIIPLDSASSFEMGGMIFQDTAVMTFQNKAEHDKALNMAFATLPLSKLFSSTPRSFIGTIKPVNMLPQNENIKDAYLASMNAFDKDVVNLSNVVLAKSRTKNKTQSVSNRYATGVFSGMARTTLDFINDPIKTNPNTNIFEYLKGRLSSLNITGSQGNYTVVYRASMSLSGGFRPAAIYLDGMESSSLFVSTIPMSQIAMVQVFTNGLAGGSNGALAVYTKKGDDLTQELTSEFNSSKIEGFSPVKEFFSPDYKANPSVGDRDTRSTLYWNPYLETSPDNKSFNFRFYNSDNASKFKVVLNGVTEDGKLIYIEKIIE